MLVVSLGARRTGEEKTREGFVAERKRSSLRWALVVHWGNFLRSRIRSVKICFRFDSRWLAAYAVLLVFCC